jgi:NAD-dependent SIR2 family protein deacetylase
MEKCPDLVLVVGTWLEIKGSRSLVANMRVAARSIGGKTFWISKEEPSSAVKSLCDYVYQDDCDAIAQLYNSEPRPYRLTYDRLCDYDDRLTDVLVDHVRL